MHYNFSFIFYYLLFYVYEFFCLQVSACLHPFIPWLQEKIGRSYYCTCVSGQVSTCCWPRSAWGIKSPGTAVTSSYEPPYRCWEINLDPLEEQPVLLNASHLPNSSLKKQKWQLHWAVRHTVWNLPMTHTVPHFGGCWDLSTGPLCRFSRLCSSSLLRAKLHCTLFIPCSFLMRWTLRLWPHWGYYE